MGLFRGKSHSIHLRSAWHHWIPPTAGTFSSVTVKADQNAAESCSGAAMDRWGPNYIWMWSSVPKQLLERCRRSQPSPHSVSARQSSRMGRSRDFPYLIIPVLYVSFQLWGRMRLQRAAGDTSHTHLQSPNNSCWKGKFPSLGSQGVMAATG